MNKRIEKITLHRFRGATTTTEVTFNPHKPLVFIYGENGSGKSSIADAIDFVCNRSAGSLADRSSTKAKEHLPAIGHAAREIKVELVCGGRAWTAKYNGAKIQVNDEANLPVAHVLRRTRLLNLIDATPSERYKQLQKFVDVEGVEQSEQSLREAVREAARTLDEKSRAKVEAESGLEQFWIDEGMPGAPQQNALSWAMQQVAANVNETRAKLERLQKLIDRLDQAAQTLERFRRAEAEAAQKSEEVLEAQRAAAAAAGIDATEVLQLIELLRDARRYLNALSDRAGCPVCEQPIVVEDLRQRVDERLNAMTTLGELRDRLEATNKSHLNALAIVERDRNGMLTAARSMVDAIKNASVPSLAALPADEENLPKLIEDASAQRGAMIAQRDEVQKTINQFNSINQFYRRIIECDVELDEAETLRLGLERALNVVQSERIAFTQRVLAEVRDETNRLYALIHPEEPLGLDALLLDEKRKGSLLQICSFEGFNDVAPQAYFSESHLDTLGFCLWLAIAKLSTGGDAIVVLDDIFTSLDNPHFTRILDLLMDESENFNQVIVTTHNRQWLDLYSGQRNPEDKSCFIQLQGWTRDDGIRSAQIS